MQLLGVPLRFIGISKESLNNTEIPVAQAGIVPGNPTAFASFMGGRCVTIFNGSKSLKMKKTKNAFFVLVR